MVELNAYLPEIFYRNGAYERGFEALMDQLDPGLPRREYPEVSYTAVGHVVGMLMGVNPLASEGVIETKSRLTESVRWGEISDLPTMENKVFLRHDGKAVSTLRNLEGPPLTWRAVFPGSHLSLVVEGRPQAAAIRHDPGEGTESWIDVTVPSGEERVVEVQG
jgi:hypothetical protein